MKKNTNVLKNFLPFKVLTQKQSSFYPFCLTPSDLFCALQSQDKTSFLRAEGIGLSLLLVLSQSLKDKVTLEQPSLVLQPEPFQEAVSAFVHLGYSQKEIS